VGAVPDLVVDILAARSVAEVRHDVVATAAVFVADLHTRRRRPEKCLSYEQEHVPVSGDAIHA